MASADSKFPETELPTSYNTRSVDNHKKSGVVITIAILLACCPCIYAFDPSLDVSQCAHTPKVGDGLFKGAILGLKESTSILSADSLRGGLWIGAKDGLAYFQRRIDSESV